MPGVSAIISSIGLPMALTKKNIAALTPSISSIAKINLLVRKTNIRIAENNSPVRRQ
jgi:hypothetical protein